MDMECSQQQHGLSKQEQKKNLAIALQLTWQSHSASKVFFRLSAFMLCTAYFNMLRKGFLQASEITASQTEGVCGKLVPAHDSGSCSHAASNCDQDQV